MNPTLVQSILTFAIRRGVTILGGSAAAISDDQITQVVSFLLVVGNEAYQAYQAHRAAKAKPKAA